jgi:SAM-dependent methyltransferase
VSEGWWTTFFDEDYLATYLVRKTDDEDDAEAQGVARLAGIDGESRVLDAPCGYGRIALPLARRGYRVTGLDLSQVQLDEARRRLAARTGVELELVQGDLRALPFADGRFDAVLNLFTSIGYAGEEGDAQLLRELARVARPGGRLVLETMHRDRLVTIFTPRTWVPLPDGGMFLQERSFDPASGVSTETHTRVHPDGRRSDRRFQLRCYAVPEIVRLVEAAGFRDVACAGGYDGEPLTRDTRLVLSATR